MEEKWVVDPNSETIENVLIQYIKKIKSRTFNAVNSLPSPLRKAAVMSLELSTFSAQAKMLEYPKDFSLRTQEDILWDEKLANTPF